MRRQKLRAHRNSQHKSTARLRLYRRSRERAIISALGGGVLLRDFRPTAEETAKMFPCVMSSFFLDSVMTCAFLLQNSLLNITMVVWLSDHKYEKADLF